jgi:hypothetical protein
VGRSGAHSGTGRQLAPPSVPLSLFGYTAYVDSRGEVRRWTNQRGWAFLELMPVRIRVQRIVDAWVEWVPISG